MKNLLSECKKNHPLAPCSTFKIGGAADYFYECGSVEDLEMIIAAAQAESLPFVVIGGGSNTIFSEKGFRGVVIKMVNRGVEIEGERVTAEAGALFGQVIMQSIKAGLTGMEPLFGIPGTIGGAVRGNAGAHGVEIKDVLESVTAYSVEKGVHEVAPGDLEFEYRHSRFKTNRDVVLKAVLKLTLDEEKAKNGLIEIVQIQKKRNAKYPTEPNCGSFFKNPAPETPAGMLIDQAGLKGLRVGGAMVSEKHGNFLINVENATQGDVLELSSRVTAAVKEKFDVELEKEVQFVGETGLLV